MEFKCHQSAIQADLIFFRNANIPASIILLKEDKKQFWIYVPGEGSRLWEEFYRKGIMGIGWEELGD